MDNRIARDFYAACNEAFGFLVRDHGFQSPILEVNTKIHFAFVSFVGRNVAVECVFDENEEWVEIKIAKVVDGAKPTDYSTDSSGHRVRESLYPLLLKRGVRSFGPSDPSLPKKPLNEMFRVRLSKDAKLLKDHGTDIIGDSPTVFGA